MMKTWTLVWLLIFPPNDSGQANFEEHRVQLDTFSECVEQLAERDEQFRNDTAEGKLWGHTIYCRDNRGVKVEIEQR